MLKFIPMTFKSLYSSLCLMLLVGFPQVQAQSVAQAVERSIQVDGVSRTYLLHIPPSHPAISSLVIVFHGGGGTSHGMSDLSGMDAVADKHGFVVAYPQGLGFVWNDGGSNLTDGKFPRNDVSFVRQLITDVAGQVPIDKRHVFACGLSNGGGMTTRLALEPGNLVAAAAMIGTPFYVKLKQAHPNPEPKPVMFVEGTDDPCVPYKGGETLGPKFGGMFRGGEHGRAVSTDDAIAFWCRINNCADTPQSEPIAHISRDDTTTVYKRWTGKDGNDVVAYIVHGGGHCWPGGRQYMPISVVGKTTYDFSASEAIWRFFANHGGHSQ